MSKLPHLMKLKIQMVLLLTFIVLVVTSCSPKHKGASALVVEFQQKECQTFIQSLSSNFEYGWVTVPENYENPSSGPQIKVFYWYEKKNKPKRSVIFFNGGPGFHSHDESWHLKRGLKKNNLNDADTALIFVDQRGTGCSTSYPDPINDTEKLRARFYGSAGIVHDAEVIRKKLLVIKNG